MKSLASSSIATHLVLGVHQLSLLAQVSSILNSAHLNLVGVVGKNGRGRTFFRKRAHCRAPVYMDSWTRP